MPAKLLELKNTIRLIQELNSEITDIETEIKSIMDGIDFPILAIHGISYRVGAIVLSEIGDFSKFDSPDKILAYLDYFRPPINLGNWSPLTPIWKSEVQGIYAAHYLTLLNLSAFGIQHLLSI
ncbi:Transposase IS116/IS110/IS902 family protein [Anaerocolumna xylanovorans DSM 12503]|uniref:Transposase IS116/IS110/IS902 family protein n=1 Tax=Anaerocolumna xylanovorans DSM 12503 TaxID=1121345 RepID=A0A1M7YHI6_9FIRM|nr:Transposase IS116/IS110/IS902 family protein [Anaerocolumna xylanovorans DSM 12503]